MYGGGGGGYTATNSDKSKIETCADAKAAFLVKVNCVFSPTPGRVIWLVQAHAGDLYLALPGQSYDWFRQLG